MEKIIVKPESIRCLGNVISPKNVSNFNSNGSLSSTNGTVNGQNMTVYTLTGGG